MVDTQPRTASGKPEINDAFAWAFAEIPPGAVFRHHATRQTEAAGHPEAER